MFGCPNLAVRFPTCWFFNREKDKILLVFFIAILQDVRRDHEKWMKNLRLKIYG